MVLGVNQMKIWDNLLHFNENEAWGDPSKIDHMLLFILDGLRASLKSRVTILNAYAIKGHESGSQHYLGRATDFYCPDLDYSVVLGIIIEYLENTKIGNKSLAEVVGLGIYPHNNFFHLDVRGYEARWGRIKVNGEDKYVSFEEALKEI